MMMKRIRRRIGPWLRAYLLLLSASFITQFYWPGFGARSACESDSMLHFEEDPGALSPVLASPIDLSILEWGERGEEPPLILLHGSPGAASNFDELAPLLAEDRWVIAVDLPGHGASTRMAGNYRLPSQADRIFAVMDRLEIARAHVLGFSYGGAIAITMADRAPERIASLTMLGAIGIQEGEGTGDHAFEHLKYRVGYGAFVVVPEGIPHFGVFGDRTARHGFIRSFMDLDQRPLRAMLDELTVPTLILHGAHDVLVAPWVAREHHRLVEPSTLVLMDGSHFMLFIDDGPQRLAEQLRPFLELHDDPAAPAEHALADLRTDTDLAELPSDLSIERGVNPWLQMILIALATLVSEDLTCVAAGLLASRGQLDYFVALFGCYLGIFGGDVGLWLIGRIFGRRLLRIRFVARRLPQHRMDRLGRLLDDHLAKAIIASRFMPGTRLVLYVTAGIIGRRTWGFFFWFLVAAGLWVPAVVTLVFLLGDAAVRPLEAFFGNAWIAMITGGILIFAVVRIIMDLLTAAGRGRLKANISRIWRWEFWPAWIFYLPVVPWVAWLVLRHRGFPVTACNPSIPHGGLVGESKWDIIRLIPARALVPSDVIEPDEIEDREKRLAGIMEERGWTFPLIFKPDIGERGSGVKLVRAENAAHEYFHDVHGRIVVQTYHPGPHEAGVLYYRRPGESTGHIFSITHKKFSTLIGDGRHTVRDLIWKHPRFRMQGRLFCKRHVDRLEDVLGEGETLNLAVAGNHCQGTMFLDGHDLITPELTRAFDEVCREIPGFSIGRFDVRYADRERFMAGEEISILELNGVTGEPTNMYDPSHSLLTSYRILFRHWRLLFEIGADQQRDGARATPLSELPRIILRHLRRRQPFKTSD